MSSSRCETRPLRPDSAGAHASAVIWFTGLSGAGKTTIAHIVRESLCRSGRKVFVLDGDNLRRGLCSDLAFSDADRSENLRRASEVGALLADEGFIVLAAFITPRQADRERIRRRFHAHTFIEVFVDAPLPVVELRDAKGLYRRARRGEIQQFTGVDSPFDVPCTADLRLDTTTSDAVSLAAELIRRLSEELLIPRGTGEARS